MMPYNQAKVLNEIQMLVERGEYDKSFKMCKKNLNIKDDPALYYFAALSLFGLGHIHQSEKYIEKHGLLSEYSTSYLYLCAYLELHKNHFDRSLLYWTRIVNSDPSDTFADALIEELKTSSNNIQSKISNPARFSHFVPVQYFELISDGPPSNNPDIKSGSRIVKASLPYKKIVLYPVLLILAATILYAINHQYFIIDKFIKLSGLADDKLPEIPAAGSVTPENHFTDDKPRFFYGDHQEVIREFKKARKLIIENKPNQARFYLGKIELSNASFEIKERALQLRESIPRSYKNNFIDTITIDQVMKEPYIYRGADVLFTGTIENTANTVENIQRMDVTIDGQESRHFLILYDFGAQTGHKKITGLKKDVKIEIFGVFHNKKAKKAIFHASNIKILH